MRPDANKRIPKTVFLHFSYTVNGFNAQQHRNLRYLQNNNQNFCVEIKVFFVRKLSDFVKIKNNYEIHIT